MIPGHSFNNPLDVFCDTTLCCVVVPFTHDIGFVGLLLTSFNRRDSAALLNQRGRSDP